MFGTQILPHQLRDLVQQMTSRLLVETVLRDPPSAELFHRSWQHRQGQVTPLIGTIAMSMRSLLQNAGNKPAISPLLRRLDLDSFLPSFIAISNCLTQVDAAAFPPVALPRGRRGRSTTRRQALLPANDLEEAFGIEFAAEEDHLVAVPGACEGNTDQIKSDADVPGQIVTGLSLFCQSQEAEEAGEEDLVWPEF